MYRQLDRKKKRDSFESFLVFFLFIYLFFHLFIRILRNPDTFVTFDSIWQRSKLLANGTVEISQQTTLDFAASPRVIKF
jgi:hypothetical protein